MWCTLTFVAVLLFILWMAWRDINHPLHKVAGPSQLPILGSILETFMMSPRELFLKNRELVATFRDRFVFKILHKRILNIYRPDDVEVILAHTKNISKSSSYAFMQPWLGSGLLLSTGNLWHRRRKILTPAFHFKILQSFVETMQERSQDLVQQLQDSKGRPLDLFPLISDVTLFTICETAMGIQLDRDKSASTLEYKQAISEIGHLIISRLTRVWLHNDYIFRLSSIGKRFSKVLPKLHSFCDAVILERKRKLDKTDHELAENSEIDYTGLKKKMAMLDLLLEAESKGEINLEEIRDEVNTFMFEGHDTTAWGLTFALMLLADHEHIQEEIYKEIQQVLGNNSSPTIPELSQLKYLEAVIKEVLRLYPSVPFLGRRVTEDFKLGDLLIPRDSVEVAIRVYDLHRQADQFPEPDAFQPQRFLDGSPRHPYAYLPFSAGPRNCIGQRFAMLEMKTMLVAICRNFTLVPQTKGWRPKLVADLVIRSIEPIYHLVNFVPRT